MLAKETGFGKSTGTTLRQLWICGQELAEKSRGDCKRKGHKSKLAWKGSCAGPERDPLCEISATTTSAACEDCRKACLSF